MTSPDPQRPLEELELPFERDEFMRDLLGEIAETLQDVVGIEEASGFVSAVGQRLGLRILEQYRQALEVDTMPREQVARVLVDLKKRLEGDFHLVEVNENRIVLKSRCCPFGKQVEGRPALCMMTSNVFGVIAAENLGYGKVELDEAIARGHSECRIVVHLERTPEARAVAGREYFRGGPAA